jgi:hypothetical protein
MRGPLSEPLVATKKGEAAPEPSMQGRVGGMMMRRGGLADRFALVSEQARVDIGGWTFREDQVLGSPVPSMIPTD